MIVYCYICKKSFTCVINNVCNIIFTYVIIIIQCDESSNRTGYTPSKNGEIPTFISTFHCENEKVTNKNSSLISYYFLIIQLSHSAYH